jgi:hypothetical protein
MEHIQRVRDRHSLPVAEIMDRVRNRLRNVAPADMWRSAPKER